MGKFTLPPQLDDSIIESEKESEVNYNCSSKNVVPIIKDGTLYLYKVDFKPNFLELVSKYNEEYSDVVARIVSDDEYEKYYSPYARYKDLRYYETVINERSATTEELEKHLNMNEEQKKEFIQNNAIDIKEKVPVDEEHWQEAFRKERYDEIIERIARNTRVLEFENKSKIAELVRRLDQNMELSFIASNIYKYITNTHKDFSTILTRVVTQDMNYISLIDFTSKEKELSEEEKYKVLREIYSRLKIECIYSRNVEDITQYEYDNMFGGEKKQVEIIANMNGVLLNDSEFSPIFKKIKETTAFGMTPDECYESYQKSQEEQPIIKKVGTSEENDGLLISQNCLFNLIEYLEQEIEKDKPVWYGDGNYHQTSIYDGELKLLDKIKDLQEKAFGMTPDECYESYKKSQEGQPKQLVKKPKKDNKGNK